MAELNAKFGIDLSSYQHPNGAPIDYQAVKNSGLVTFAYIKATEGKTYTNPDFGEDYFGLKGVGIEVGAYLFWDFADTDIQGQVDYFAQHYTWRDDDLIPYIDAERNDTNRPWSDIKTTLEQATQELVAKGYPKVGWYMNRNWQQNLQPSGVSIWLAEGENEEPASIMQFGTKSIPGIQGDVDWNVA